MIRSPARAIVLLLVWSLPCFAQRVHAQDRIWIEPRRPSPSESDWYPKAIETINAKIIQLDDKQLRYVIDGRDDERECSSKRLIWMEPMARSAVERQAIDLFHDGQYSMALEKLPQVLEQRPPVWYQQWFTMMAAVAASRSGRSKIALELIAQLDRRPLPPLVVAWLPIEWQNHKATPDAVTQAVARLKDPSALVQLTAASWLISSPQRSEALAALASLQSSERMEIRALAEVLRWRTATPPIVKESAQGWQQNVDRLPMVWQTGPTRTLIEKFKSTGLSDHAKRMQWSLDLTPIHPSP
jgi:hypothetical protein